MVSIWHTDTLTGFNLKLYDGLLNKEHIVSNEVCKKYNDCEYYGFVLEKENPKTKMKERYFVQTKDITELPLTVLGWQKFSSKSEVFRMVLESKTSKIPSRKEMNFRDLVSFYSNYEHSNPNHWLLSRIIILAAYFERLNIRIVSEASYGKDALVDILNILNGNVSNLYNATLGKLKYALNSDLIVINELGGLKKEEVGSLQVYLTQAGSYKPKYENNSRSTAGTKEVMDLRNKSHVIFHNTPEYYESKGQQYFEQMFTPAIMDRFPALLLDGWVKEDFSHSRHINDIEDSEIAKLKAFIATLNYYKDNLLLKAKYAIDDGFWRFSGKEKQRSLRSFKIIIKYIAEYCQSEAEFKEICELLKKCRFDYLIRIGKSQRVLEEEIE